MTFFEPVLRLTPRASWICLIILSCPLDVLYTMSLAIEPTTLWVLTLGLLSKFMFLRVKVA